MSLLSSVGDFFALDIGTTAIRVVQLKGTLKSNSLAKYGAIPIDVKLAQSDADEDQTRLAAKITELLSEASVTSRNVVVGIPSSKVFATVVDMPNVSTHELEKTVKYQAEQFIPIPIDEAKVDTAVLGPSPAQPEKVEVLLASTPNSFAEKRLDMLESVGLKVLALEPDGIALTRSLIQPGQNGAYMILDIGDRFTDLVVALNGAPRLLRSIPVGGSSMINAAVQNLNIDAQQAKQFIYKFGLAPDKLEGQVMRSLEHTLEALVTEVDKSIKFFTTRYKGIKLEKIILTGGASTLPQLPQYMANKTGMPIEIGNAWQNVAFPVTLQNELIAISSQFAVAVGLAERSV